MKKNKAVFLDRDGTINVDKGFVYRIEDFEFIDGVPEAIRLLNKSNFKVIVITNQSGIGRGYYTEEDVQKLRHFINKELGKYDACVDKFYYCPHHAEAEIEKYRTNCECRKPNSGLLRQAINDFNIDPSESFLIGDTLRDIEPGNAVGCSTILIGACPDTKGVKSSKQKQNWKKSNLRSAVEYILKLDYSDS